MRHVDPAGDLWLSKGKPRAGRRKNWRFLGLEEQRRYVNREEKGCVRRGQWLGW